ncbi:MAG: UDP-N-acetylmuramoyl-L-alanyl-D-glutamate--2,6-diaminopimelate ligase [Chitinophagaceae bacterium]
MPQLQNILYQVRLESIRGSLDREVGKIALDSRKVTPGSLFIAIRGAAQDGHQFIPQAIQSGAIAILVEQLPEVLQDHITYIQVTDCSQSLGIIAGNFYGHPSLQLKLVGVTGTNGKTTVATLLFKLFSALGMKCGLLSTIQNQIGTTILPSTHTTPDAIELNELLSSMASAGCTHVFMEVSSHAIHQGRIEGLHFEGGIFTNITHDHLDYHKTFEEYIRVKKSFFDQLLPNAFALTNVDDKRGMIMLQNTLARPLTYSLRSMASFRGNILENNLTGLILRIGEEEVHFRLIGEFNAYNILAVYGAAISLGQNKHQVLQVLSGLDGAEGRFDYQVSEKDRIIGIVDYAHTPDALLNVLATIEKLKNGFERVITVLGCGGDRDKTKRPLMARIAVEKSDQVLLTADNPRSEDPGEILKEMEQGIPVHRKKRSITIPDRREAIKTACHLAGKEDIILVAGKGHEKYQEIMGVKYPFDDKKILTEVLAELGK